MKFPHPFKPINDNGGGFVLTPQWARQQRLVMVEKQLRKRGIRDAAVLRAMSEVERHEFVPPEHLREAYGDHPIAIGQGQTISQPYIVALMTEALELGGNERVLDVGTGSGYHAAILARLASQVFTIERDAALLQQAEKRLRRLAMHERITFLLGDGSLGWPEGAPYDAILVAAAAPKVPACFMDQLKAGGRLVIPVGTLESQELIKVTKSDHQPIRRRLGPCRFVPLTGSQGWNQT